MASKSRFIDHVVQILNEANTQSNGTLIDGDMTDVAYYVESLIPAAWRRAVGLFPLSWFVPSEFYDTTIYGDGPKGTGYVRLPYDFLALWGFRMKGWKTTCRQALEMTPAVERKQANEYTRGTPERPVCVLGTATEIDPVDGETDLMDVLRYYSLPATADTSSHVVEEALYIRAITEPIGDIPIGGKGYEPLCYLCAAMVLTSFEKYDAAKAMEGLAMNF